MSYSANILIIDDDEAVRAAGSKILKKAGYRVREAADGPLGLQRLQEESFDAVVLDWKMPEMDGMEVLRRIQETDPSTKVVMISGYGTIDTAVEAMRRGAFDFLAKPFAPEALAATVKKAVQSRHRLLEHVCVDSSLPTVDGDEIVIGRSPAMINVVQLVKKIAPTDSTVLIRGETGVGKELIARALHRLSRRRDKPFVTVDCGAIVETLFESEMFGHAKGAFTGATETTQGKFELAEGGTLFLDEIANISLAMQSRLLRVIQEREFFRVGSSKRIRVNVRIAAATHRDLAREIRERRFREDLFYRLNVLPIYLPPLRERREDIPLLASHFLKMFGGKTGRAVPKLSEEALQFLKTYDWPGNVRELKNTIERAVFTCEGGTIKRADISSPEAAQVVESTTSRSTGSLAELEKEQIVRVLERFNGHKSKTADHLGINRKTLREKMHKYGIER
jgi:two-component system response regulator HydG